MILSQAGYSVDLAVAGILHDTLEDTNLSIDRIEDLFGSHVSSIVQGCTEPGRILPWKVRKQHPIEYLKKVSPEIRAVACADKLHNPGACWLITGRSVRIYGAVLTKQRNGKAGITTDLLIAFVID